jgi:electron transport complex protein RnfG
MAASEGSVVRTLSFVGIIAVAAALLVTSSYEFAKDRIAANQRARDLESLNSVLDPAIVNADLNAVLISATDPELLGTDEPIDVYIALSSGRPAAAVFKAIAPDGYNAEIQLLVGISTDEKVTGVRVVRHRETPGLGDAIDIAKSDWIRQFDGTSLADPPLPLWAVDKDEGAFDSITGATVTPRAVVKAVKNTLLYFAAHKDELFAAAARSAADGNDE